MTDTAMSPIHLVPTEQDLRALVKPDPHKIGRAWWRLRRSERPIWPIIMHIIHQGHIMAEGNTEDPTQATDAIIAQTAADYRIPEIGVRAAIAYYAANRSAIDTRLAINDAATARQ